MWKPDRIYYLNRADRPDRREHLEDHLKHFGFRPLRVEAKIYPESHGFLNRAVYGNWMSHTNLISLAKLSEAPIVIVEDDVEIVGYTDMLKTIQEVLNLEHWDMAYFYGSQDEKLQKIIDTPEFYAYMVNPSSSDLIVEALETQRITIEQTQPKDVSTCIDNFMISLQHKMNFYGGTISVIQGGGWGSDTGRGRFWQEVIIN